MIKTKTLDRIIETIVEDCRPEKIFLVSHFERDDNFSHPTLDIPADKSRIAKYDVLVLVHQERNYEDMSEFIEGRAQVLAKVTAFVHPLEKFNQVLAYGHPFAKALVDKNCLVYDADTTDLTISGTIDEACQPNPGTKEYTHAMMLAEEFLAATNLHLVRKDNQVAAYNLQQCAVQLYMAAIQKGTGLKMVTEDLTRLQRYSYWFSSDMRNILHVDSQTNVHQARQLQKAHYHTRFNPDYEVSDLELHTLMGAVRKLYDLTMKIIREPGNN